MNTIRSTYYGWGVLIVAGAGSYYFAKKSVNADRAERQEKELRRRKLAQALEDRARYGNPTPPPRPKSTAHSQLSDPAASPSGEASVDPAPTAPSPPVGSANPPEKGRYEPAQPFRSKKGDRFS